MDDCYRTIAGEAQAVYIEKRSRFIACIRPAQNEEAALALLEEKRRSDWSASHHVYAYLLRDRQLQRYSDDGEPQGTAGLPILNVLQKASLTDCALVVTRYFGGTLLGTGGLVRAYSTAARMAVDAAGEVTMSLCALASLSCSYAQLGWVQPLLLSQGAVLDEPAYAEEVSLSFALPRAQLVSLCHALTEQSAGTLMPTLRGEEYRVTQRG